MSPQIQLIHGDCLEELPLLDTKFQLIYLDPPFFTGNVQRGVTRDGSREYSYNDSWPSLDEYLDYMRVRIQALIGCASPNASIVYHCDSRTSHHARLLIETLVGPENFRSEIIWTYRRWSNTKRGLIPAHQNLLWFTLGDNYTFNPSWDEYSPATNVDQLLQMRTRDARNKSVYASDEAGNPIPNGTKKGVPLSDVWDIPYLNPKARERVGYPTQKPVTLLERIVDTFSNPGDNVLDPFCGSGTTIVTAKTKGRSACGIDVSREAIDLCRARLESPVITRSRVLDVGREDFRSDENAWAPWLTGVPVTPVHRNSTIDAVLETGYQGLPVLLRVQRPGESILDLSVRMAEVVKKKQAKVGFIVQTEPGTQGHLFDAPADPSVRIVRSASLEITAYLSALDADTETNGDAVAGIMPA